MNVSIKLIADGMLPTLGSNGAAAFDAYARIDERIKVLPGETVKIPLGFALEIPSYLVGLLFARSGKGCAGLRPGNCVGVIDSDYRGEVAVCLHNDSNEWHTVEPGEKVCQLLFIDRPQISLRITDQLSETPRGNGGFGSTG